MDLKTINRVEAKLFVRGSPRRLLSSISERDQLTRRSDHRSRLCNETSVILKRSVSSNASHSRVQYASEINVAFLRSRYSHNRGYLSAEATKAQILMKTRDSYFRLKLPRKHVPRFVLLLFHSTRENTSAICRLRPRAQAKLQ